MFSYKVDDDIQLALPRLKDAVTVFELIQKDQDYFGEWLPWVYSTKTVEDERQFLKTSLEHFGVGKSLNLLIWYRGQYVGNLSFNTINTDNRSADIGYLLGKDFQHRGIMNRSVNALLKIGFTEYDLEKIIIKAATANQPSNHVIQKLGLHLDGVERHAEKANQHWIDLNVYSILREEWQQ